METSISAWTRRGAAMAIGAGLVLAIGWIAVTASGVLLLVFLSVLLASGLEPLVDWLRGRLPTGRVATVLLVYGAFFVVVLLVGLVVVPGAIAQGQAVVDGMPDVLARARTWADGLRPAAVSSTIVRFVDEIGDLATPTAPRPGDVVQASLTVAEVLVATATVLSIVIFWLIERVRLQRYALAFLPAERRAGARDAWNEVESRLGLWVRGQLVLMGAIGVATGVAYSLVGLPAALLLALVAALCEAIPIVGPLMGAVPALLVALTISPELALVVAFIYVVIQLVEGNVLVPLIMRNAIGLSPFLVLVSLLIGAAVAGVVGAFVAVPIAASLEVVLERVQAREVPVAADPTAGERGAREPDPVAEVASAGRG
jgi:predicted PurR-regulated permease PerM